MIQKDVLVHVIYSAHLLPIYFSKFSVIPTSSLMFNISYNSHQVTFLVLLLTKSYL